MLLNFKVYKVNGGNKFHFCADDCFVGMYVCLFVCWLVCLLLQELYYIQWNLQIKDTLGTI